VGSARVEAFDTATEGGSMKAKFLGVVAALVALAAAASASAATPTVVVVNVDRTINFAAGDLCSFPVTLHNVGVRRTTTYTDSSGNVTRTVIHLAAFTQSVTNDLNGKTLTTPLAGPAIFEPNGDGTVTTRIPGNDGIIVVPGEGFVYGDVGLIVYTELDVLMLTGHYENPDRYVEELCASLA
jgi:hypothetical protein